MDLDKSADTSSATSTFSTVSNTSIRTTRAAASKSLDFSLAEGLPSRRRRARPFRDQILPAIEMESALVAQPEGSVLPNSLSNIILRNKYDFGRDSAGLELVPPSIPLCRLAHMEKVRFLQRNGEAVEKLDSLFRTEGYCEIDTAKFYVVPTDSEGEDLFISEEEKVSWDDVWKQQDLEFERDCDRHESFKFLKSRKFSVFDGNHRLFAWMEVAKEFPKELKYHPRVNCVILRGDKSSMVPLEQAMHGINK